MQALPEFPEQIDLAFEHQTPIGKILHAKNILSSDFAFYNLMGWYQTRPSRISRLDHHILLNLEGPDGKCLLLAPLGADPIRPLLERLLEHLPQLGCPQVLSYVPKSLLVEIQSAFPQVIATPQRNDFDYIYSRRELAELSGRRFHQKKNFVNRVVEEWNPVVRDLGPDTLEPALAYLQNWYEDAATDDPTMRIEALAALRMLPHLTKIGGLGILVEIEGRVAGLSVASPVHPNCFVVSLEKADKNRKGLYQFVNWAMANRIPAAVELINRETDLGIEGLRTAKTSYHPIQLEEKFTLRFD